MLPVHYLYISGSESDTELKLRNTHSVNKTPFNFHFNFHILFNCQGSGWKAATAKALCIHLIELYELKHLIHFSAHCRWQEGNTEPPSNHFPALQSTRERHGRQKTTSTNTSMTPSWFPSLLFAVAANIHPADGYKRVEMLNPQQQKLLAVLLATKSCPLFAFKVIDWPWDGFENHRPLTKAQLNLSLSPLLPPSLSLSLCLSWEPAIWNFTQDGEQKLKTIYFQYTNKKHNVFI